MSIPVIDIRPLLSPALSPTATDEAMKVSRDIYEACSTWGFFQITGHNVSVDIQNELVRCTKGFFVQEEKEKLALHVRNGGVAWRGYMPFGGEKTHGRKDQKAGMYFGPEHPDDHLQKGQPLHGKNQFPDKAVPGMRPAVLEYIKQVTELGKTISDAISLSLGLDRDFIRDKYLQPNQSSFSELGNILVHRTWM